MKHPGTVAHIEQGVRWSERHPFLQVRTTFASRHPYATHFHDCLSLGVVFKGGTMLRRGSAASTVGEGQAVLIAPLEPHSCNPVGGRARGYHMFYIETGWVLKLLNAPLGGQLNVDKNILDDKDLFDTLMHLADAVREGSEDRPGCEALAGMLTKHCSVLPASEEASSAAFAEWAEGQGASVAEGARRAGMRRESFIRSFRRAAGVTPAQYRQCLRLNRARELLRQGCSLVETALACGYADQSHFHRMCVKYLSATPVQMKPRRSLSFKK